MGRVFITIFVVVGLIAAMASLYKDNSNNLVSDFPQQVAPAATYVAADSSDFNETGTLVFYPNNVGPVPYIFYQDSQGHLASKALIFQNGSRVDSSWVGARVWVTGKIVSEHVIVDSISYVSGP